MVGRAILKPTNALAVKGEPCRDRPVCGAWRRRDGGPPLSRGAYRQCLTRGEAQGREAQLLVIRATSGYPSGFPLAGSEDLGRHERPPN